MSRSRKWASALITAIPNYALTIATSGSGTVAADPAPGPYASNSVVTLTANAAENWAFDHWTGGLSGSANPASLTMNRPTNVTAFFVQTMFPVTLSTPGGGTLAGQATYYPVGQPATFTATPAAGWQFLNWGGAASGSNNPLSLTVTGAMSLQGYFGTTVNANAVGAGRISLTPASLIAYGASVSATAVPDDGYYFVQWGNALSGTNNPKSLPVTTATPTISALFAALPPTPPFIITQPQNIRTAVGRTVTLNMRANGSLPLNYQWRKDGANLPGATSATLNFISAQTNDVGNYLVLVTNAYRSVTSAPASLFVSSIFFQAPAGMTADQIKTQGFSLSLLLETNRNYSIQVTTNLQSTNWMTLTNCSGTNAVFQFLDSAATNDARRFYRVISP